MTRITLLTTAVLLLFAGSAQAKPWVGIGDQHAQLFSDARWQALDAPRARYVMPWDALRYRRQRLAVDAYLYAARSAGAEVLLSFGHSERSKRKAKRMPTRRQFRRQFRALRKRHPTVTLFQAWNEANHGTQPTWKKPRRAARVYNQIKRTCRECTVTAPSVLDDGRKMVRWIKRFRRKARGKVRIWTLHNHIDVNRNRIGRSSSTKLFLRNTRGQVWFTETGGIWNRWIGRRKVRKYKPRTAVRAIKNVFKLARKNRRVKRIYIYNWFGPRGPRPRWDSGLVNATLRERRTLRTLRAQMRRYAR